MSVEEERREAAFPRRQLERKHLVTTEEAIKTAIEYEMRVQALYAEAAKAAKDQVAQRVLQVLADEETDHVEHLLEILDHVKRAGEAKELSLKSALPSREAIEAGIRKLRADLPAQGERPEVTGEIDLLQKALEVEIETGSFYKRMVSELGEEGQRLFGPFVEIEEGHRAIVQAELDHLTGTGYWFDLQEFGLEGD
jgi:rubrerythrin